MIRINERGWQAMPHKVPGDRIRGFLLRKVRAHPFSLVKETSRHFTVPRDVVRRHLLQLVAEGKLESLETRRGTWYGPKVDRDVFAFRIAEKDQEDIVWGETIAPLLAHFPENILRLCYYGFTEMYNNAVDHSEGTKILVTVEKDPHHARLVIRDNGVGIFEKIKDRFNLLDHREALLELAKGKLTTDPERHSGQGIFFTSRAFDDFSIISGDVMFSHRDGEERDWMIEDGEWVNGTMVNMRIEANCKRTLSEVFDRFTGDDEDLSFSKTHVPLKMARYGKDELISRSQAKRVLSRFERFEEVLLDFEGVDFIGQAFADEIFRVFHNQYPDIKIFSINENDQIEKMIRFVQKQSDARTPESDPDDSGPERQ